MIFGLARIRVTQASVSSSISCLTRENMRRVRKAGFCYSNLCALEEFLYWRCGFTVNVHKEVADVAAGECG